MEQDQTFYIKIENGSPVGNPFLLDNLIQFGINPENSTDWSQYIPSGQKPITRHNDIAEEVMNFDGKITKCIWSVRNMTSEEIAARNSPLDTMPGSAPNVIY